MSSKPKPKKVVIVGAGAAGMSCAHQLANHPDKFQVTLIEASDYCGGQAFSIPLDAERHGAGWLNQGVQGGSYIFRHTFAMFHQQGYSSTPVRLQVSFGRNENYWTNVYPTKLVEKHRSEIKRFVKVLKIVRAFEAVFLFVPIWLLMKMFWFSNEFSDYMIMPTLALFLGTGNATPSVNSVILERLFTSPTFGMWYKTDPESLVSNNPPMVVFPNFSDFYGTWKKDLEKKGVDIRLSTEVTRVIKRSSNGVIIGLKSRTPTEDGHNPIFGDQDAEEVTETYDEIVFACLADTARRLLGKNASWAERFVLTSTKWSDDVTVTHWDSDYMTKHYENHWKPDVAVENLHGRDESFRISQGKEYAPQYYIKMYPEDPTKLEMAFDCSNYQAQFPKKPNATNPDELQVSGVPFDRHVFQTIFLNKNRDSHLWSKNEINPDKIIREDWWHQLEHHMNHYLFVVPWMWLLNGKHNTRYAGSWTLVNAHELAVISGMSAAYTLGADYPIEMERDDEGGRWSGFALLCFRMYTLISHGKWYKAKTNVKQYPTFFGKGVGNDKNYFERVDKEEDKRMVKIGG